MQACEAPCLFQYRDEDLPVLEYGPRHLLIENTINNSVGDLPFTSPGDQVLTLCCLHDVIHLQRRPGILQFQFC